MIEGPDARGMVPRYVQSVRVWFFLNLIRRKKINSRVILEMIYSNNL